MANVKKKIILAASVLAICAAMAGTGTLAYFVVEDTATNVITTGGIDIDLVEKTKLADGSMVDFPEKMEGIMPGTTVSKIVSVKNTGPNSAWVRVKVDAEISNASGEKLSLEVGGGKAMDVQIQDGWTDGGDGYFYFDKKLKPGKSTPALFEEVYFNANMDNSYQSSTAMITVKAEAVQTDNNGDTVMEAAGWTNA